MNYQWTLAGLFDDTRRAAFKRLAVIEMCAKHRGASFLFDTLNWVDGAKAVA